MRGHSLAMVTGIAVVGIAGVVAATNALVLGRSSPWIVVTSPLTSPFSVNAVIGYSYLMDGGLIHRENLSPLYNALAFNGYGFAPDGYYLRALYPFLVSILSPFMGVIMAAHVINYLSYGGLVTVTARLAYRLAGTRRASVGAGLLALLGIGPIVHVNDLSAHLLSFFLYGLVVLVVFESSIWARQRPAVVHLGIGFLLAIATLGYTVGAELTLAYLGVAAVRTRSWSVAAAGALGFGVRPAWQAFLTSEYEHTFALHNLNFGEVDQDALAVSLQGWHNLLLALGVPGVLHELLRESFDGLFVSFPVVVVISLIASVAVFGRSFGMAWFALLFFAVPYAGMLLFGQGAAARGYIVYGTTVIPYAALATWLLRGPTRSLRAAFSAGSFLLLVVGQAIWALSNLRGYYFPIVSYFVGYSWSPDPTVVPTIRSLTDGVPTWQGFSGSGTFAEAGGLVGWTIAAGPSVARSRAFELALRAFVAFPAFALLGLAAWHHRRRWLCLVPVAWLATALQLMWMGAAFEHETLTVLSPDRLTNFQETMQIGQAVDVAPALLEEIRDLHARRPSLELVVYTRSSGLHDAALTLGDQPVRLTLRPNPNPCCASQEWTVDLDQFATASRTSNHLNFSAIADRGAWVGGWQRPDLPGRWSWPSTEHAGIYYTPAMELRLRDARDRNTSALVIAY